MFQANSHRNKVIKLNTNENPYAPAPGVEQALKVNGFRSTSLISGSDSRIT